MNPLPSIERRGAITRFLSLLLVLLTLIAAGTYASQQAQDGSSTAAVPSPRGVTVFLVRHAEKAADDPEDPSLTEGGQARAQELARLLSSAGVSHLLSSDFKRTRQTLTPLAEANELEITLYDVRQGAALVSKLEGLPPGSVAVVAGHSNTVPALYQALGAGKARELKEPKYGSSIPDAVYDRLYVVTLLAGRDGEVECVDGLELRFGE